MQKVQLAIEGMTCGGCVKGVTNVLKKIGGVQVDNVAIGSAQVSYDPQLTSPAKICQALGTAGYPAEQVAGLVALALAAKKAVPTLKYVTTHAAIAPKRKTDPVGFDVEAFAKKVGLEIWSGAGE